MIILNYLSFMSTIIARILLCTIYALVSFHHHPFPHYLQKYSMAMFLFIVTWAKKNLQFGPGVLRPYILVIILIQFVCHFHIGCMKSLFSGSSSILSSLISTCFLQIQVYLHSEKANIFNPQLKFMWWCDSICQSFPQ